jgi:hypothetical protein
MGKPAQHMSQGWAIFWVVLLVGGILVFGLAYLH